jgi:hypothetical protein
MHFQIFKSCASKKHNFTTKLFMLMLLVSVLLSVDITCFDNNYFNIFTVDVITFESTLFVSMLFGEPQKKTLS